MGFLGNVVAEWVHLRGDAGGGQQCNSDLGLHRDTLEHVGIRLRPPSYDLRRLQSRCLCDLRPGGRHIPVCSASSDSWDSSSPIATHQDCRSEGDPMRRRAQRGATTIEMTLVGIPIIFLLISTFEMSRGMWMYNTAATAVREGVRFASVHGVNCVLTPPGIPNQCDVTANDIVQVMRAEPAMAPAQLTGLTTVQPVRAVPVWTGTTAATTTVVTFKSASGSFTCKLGRHQLDGLSAACNVQWPPDNDNAVKQIDHNQHPRRRSIRRCRCFGRVRRRSSLQQ